MTIETKIRTLASLDGTLVGFLGSAPFRWFDKQLPQGQLSSGTCVRMLKISGIPYYVLQGVNPLSVYRFQIDVLDLDPEVTRSVRAAIETWFGTVSFAQTNDFDSPPTTPPQFPNFILNRRAGLEFALDPPVHVETIDVRIYNLES